MDKTYKIIEDLCNARGITVNKLCVELGMSNSVLSDFKKGRTKKLSTATLQKIASYFNVPVDYLLDLGEINPKDIPPEPEISDDQLMFALWKGNPNMTKEDLERVRQFATFMEQERSLK